MTSSWMLVAGFFFAAMGVFVKLGSAQFGAAELAFYRSLVTFVVILGIVGPRRGTVRTPTSACTCMRAVVGAISLVGYFHAISKLPLATAQTLNYTSPLFLAIATVVVLGERFSGMADRRDPAGIRGRGTAAPAHVRRRQAGARR